MVSNRDFKKFAPKRISFPEGSEYHLIIRDMDLSDEKKVRLKNDGTRSPVVYDTFKNIKGSFVLRLYNHEKYLVDEEMKKDREFTVDRIEMHLPDGFFPVSSEFYKSKNVYFSRISASWLSFNGKQLPSAVQSYLYQKLIGPLFYEQIIKFEQDNNRPIDQSRVNTLLRLISNDIFSKLPDIDGKG